MYIHVCIYVYVTMYVCMYKYMYYYEYVFNLRGFDPLYAPLWTIKTHLVESPGLLLGEIFPPFISIIYRDLLNR